VGGVDLASARPGGQHQLHRIPLELVDCPDRRLSRGAVETVARDLADGETEVSVLLPDRKYRGFWHRILHDRTADAIERDVSLLPHANVTTVPFHFNTRRDATVGVSALLGDVPPGWVPSTTAACHGDARATATVANGARPAADGTMRRRPPAGRGHGWGKPGPPRPPQPHL
jgi:hypothetical protein